LVEVLLPEVRRAWLPDDRDRELPEELREPLLRELLLVLPDVRDRGGEDVRVAMGPRLRHRHTRHTLPTPHTHPS
jgi:hypothetical protein